MEARCEKWTNWTDLNEIKSEKCAGGDLAQSCRCSRHGCIQVSDDEQNMLQWLFNCQHENTNERERAHESVYISE